MKSSLAQSFLEFGELFSSIETTDETILKIIELSKIAMEETAMKEKDLKSQYVETSGMRQSKLDFNVQQQSHLLPEEKICPVCSHHYVMSEHDQKFIQTRNEDLLKEYQEKCLNHDASKRSPAKKQYSQYLVCMCFRIRCLSHNCNECLSELRSPTASCDCAICKCNCKVAFKRNKRMEIDQVFNPGTRQDTLNMMLENIRNDPLLQGEIPRKALMGNSIDPSFQLKTNEQVALQKIVSKPSLMLTTGTNIKSVFPKPSHRMHIPSYSSSSAELGNENDFELLGLFSNEDNNQPVEFSQQQPCVPITPPTIQQQALETDLPQHIIKEICHIYKGIVNVLKKNHNNSADEDKIGLYMQLIVKLQKSPPDPIRKDLEIIYSTFHEASHEELADNLFIHFKSSSK